MGRVTHESDQSSISNIAAGEKQTFNSLLKIMCNIQQCEFAAKYEAPRQGDIRDSYATIDKAKAILGWQPEVQLKEGLRYLI
jgi:nucleoside-diphosphate-sugar epimerase